MATAKFYLKDKKSKEETQVYLQFNFNYFETDITGKKKYVKLRYYTGEKINPRFWNSEKQRAKETKKFSGYSEFNNRLNDIEKSIFDIYRQVKNDKEIPTPELLKEKLLTHYNKYTKPTKEPHLYSLFSYFEYFIKDNSKRKQKNTIKKYKTTLTHLKNFAEIKGYKDILFKDISLDFYYDFSDYLTLDLRLAGNTVGIYIKILKTVLNDAYEKGIHDNKTHKNKKFKVFDEPTEKIYLTDNELTAIYNLDLSNNKRLDKVRDLFIIGCYTALRFSDFNRIKKENIIENGRILKFHTQKTDELVYIPIHYRVVEIMQKYDNSAPPTISNQKMNAYIKEVGKLAGIDEVIIRSQKKGNLQIEKKYKKYELITTHTARRSGATNMFKSGIPPINIMKITGHRTEKAFMRYIRITQEENAKTLLNHDYFKKPLQIAK
jgi:hypothetical protein